MRAFPFAIFLLVLLCSASFLQALPDVGCDMKCKMRCFKAAVKDRCSKYCGLCCSECRCVPSGTYGNKDECPCYRDKKSHSGKPKCP